MSCLRVFAVAVFLIAGPAQAQSPIADNDFNIDVVGGPVLAGSRVLGLGGAFAPIATGLDGMSWNPAAAVSRTAWEVDWVAWDVKIALLLPGLFSQQDYFNNDLGSGIGDVANFLFLNLGFRVQIYDGGGGVLLSSQSFTVNAPGGSQLKLEFLTLRIVTAYSFMNSQLLFGTSLMGVNLNLSLADSDGQLATFSGLGFEFGGLLRLEGQPWRAGITVRTPVGSRIEPGGVVTDTNGVRSVEGIILPTQVLVPWQVQAGFAYQFGDRPFNPSWRRHVSGSERLTETLRLRQCERELAQVRRERLAAGAEPPSEYACPLLESRAKDREWLIEEEALRSVEERVLEDATEASDRAREGRISRDYYLFSLELLLIGTSANAVGMDAMLAQERRSAGHDVSVGVRAGFETEPFHDRLKVRAGTYLEPTRNQTGSYRPHFTTGFDLRLFGLLFLDLELMVTAVVDLAPRYWDFGLGLGFWH